MVRSILFSVLVLLSLKLSANMGNIDFDPTAGAPQQNREFPIGPDHSTTPGEVCKNPDSYRYPEKIPYCSRKVDTSTKWKVIERYNTELGYHIDPKERSSYKIDHLIPLCMGGSNTESNLWPQHKSVYAITDPLEGPACEKMAAGKLLQKRAIELIREAKDNLDRAPAILKEIQSL